MLDSAIIYKPGISGGQIDAGRVLETLLYYDRVHLIMDIGLFTGLWDFFGPSDLGRLLRLPGLTAVVTPEMTAIHTETKAGVSIHKPIQFRSSGREGHLIHEKDDIGSLRFMLNGRNDRGNVSRSDVKTVLGSTKITRYAKLLKNGSSNNRFSSLVSDSDTLKLFLRNWSAEKGHVLDPKELALSKVRIVRGSSGFQVEPDDHIHRILHGLGSESPWASVLSAIQDYEIALYLSHYFSSDVVTSSGASDVASARLDLSIERTFRTREQLSSFEEFAFDEAHAFAEAINTRALSFQEAIRVIKESKKFRAWARNLPPDANLIAEYHKAVAQETALGSTPRSIARFSFFNGLGFVVDKVVPGSGMAVSAFDQFVFERLLRGWRPNVFVRNVKKSLDHAKERSLGKA